MPEIKGKDRLNKKKQKNYSQISVNGQEEEMVILFFFFFFSLAHFFIYIILCLYDSLSH